MTELVLSNTAMAEMRRLTPIHGTACPRTDNGLAEFCDISVCVQTACCTNIACWRYMYINWIPIQQFEENQ